MLVAIMVYIASFFGYTITDLEDLQEIKDIQLKPSTFTFAPGAVFRSSRAGGNTVTWTFGYEKQFTPYDRNYAFHVKYRYASSNDDTYFSGKFLNSEHYLHAGFMKFLSSDKFLYFDAGPYIQDNKVDLAFTMGVGTVLTAFGVGFRPNIHVDYVNNNKEFQIGLFANFEI